MSLLKMSLSGAIMIVVVIVIRALAINRLPKRTFLILWGVVLLRLLAPFSIPSTFSVYSLVERNIASGMLDQIPPVQDAHVKSAADVDADYFNVLDVEYNDGKGGKTIAVPYDETGEIIARRQGENRNSVISGVRYGVIIWCAGMILCIGCFTVSYLRCRFEFQMSLPVDNAFVQGWLQEHPRRLVSIRQSDRISTPLTYGIFHPVILMPKSTDWANKEHLQYVLMHEYVHIRRYDALTKLIAALALCIHWFNPMVWIMWFLFNRDVEISCDECVVRRMGESSKSAYALMLIQMESERSVFAPFCSSLSPRSGNNAMEERITAIMKIRKRSMPAVIVAAVLVISVTTAFATSAAEEKKMVKQQ